MRSRRDLFRALKSSSDFRILLAGTCIALFFGLLFLLEPLDANMKMLRSKLRSHEASGTIVIVAIDDRSLAAVGSQPWPRARYGHLLGALKAAGAKRIALDLDVSSPGDPADDRFFEQALQKAGPGTMLTSRFAIDPVEGGRIDHAPLPRFARHATVVNANLWVVRNTIWSQPYGSRADGRPMASLAAVLGGVQGAADTTFPIDYAIDVRSIPIVSASDLLDGTADVRQFAGRDVVVGSTSAGVEHLFAPGYAAIPGIFFHVLGAETLKEGRPVDIGWFAPLLFALGVCVAFMRLRRRSVARAALATGAALLIFGPIFLEGWHVMTSVAPALSLIGVAATGRLIRRLRTSYRLRDSLNPISGLPNLNALRLDTTPAGMTVVVARIQNFAEISASLSPEHERELVEQIVGRIRFTAGSSRIFQGDEGIFVWTADDENQNAITEQLEGLHALFRSPIVVSNRLIDLAVAFGIDADRSRSVIQRTSSALVAADAAAREGQRWRVYDPGELEDVEWRMSLLARLDRAIDNGELWVAYQPKLDTASGAIVGAEALVRWTHAEKGEIHPSQFVAAAEKGGRIERLTAFVLDEAVAFAAAMNTRGYALDVAVNISAKLLDGPAITLLVTDALDRHNLPPEQLTLEVTETAAIGSQAGAVATLNQLNALGVNLSIDDYGTGFSTLEYLRNIPAREIKIDRSFVAVLDKSQSDRLMVHSTIQLAHSLGRRVVAEGVETPMILNELRRMGCDLAQGFYIGRPMPKADFWALLRSLRKDAAA